MLENHSTLSPLITVITVAYNSEAFIEETIESVLNQTIDEYEYIIIDDSSSDETWNIINRFHDKRIKKYKNSVNLGEYPNRNKALGLATGEYIIFIDGDDIIYPEALEILSKYAKKHSECATICSVPNVRDIIFPLLVTKTMFFRFFFFGRPLIGQNFTKILFKREALKAVSLLPTHIRSGDTYIQMKLGLNFSSLLIEEDISWWRKRENNATAQIYSNYRYLSENLSYGLEIVNDSKFPLNETETETIFKNLYGSYLRMLVRLTIWGKFSDLRYNWSKFKVPFKYWYSIAIPTVKKDYLANFYAFPVNHLPSNKNKGEN